MGIFDRIKAASTAFRYPASMTHRGGSFLSMAPRTFPYENTDPISNSAVINTLAWIQRNFVQADFEVFRELADDEDETIDGHPLTSLIESPNTGYDAQSLWAATLLSYHLDGNAYWIKERNARGFGVPTSIWYEPHWSIKPHWPENGSAFIDYYERRINGTIEKIPIENVVHFRNGLNPANPRYGLAPLKAALLQVFTDTEVSLWVAALCRNMAIPGVVVSPAEPIGMTMEKAEQIKQTWKRKFGGDNRGEPLILDFQADIKPLGYDPKQMDFASITNLAESRISGALGIPAIVAGLSAGLDSSTYNNLANLKKSAFEECLIPTWKTFERTIARQLLIDFERDTTAIDCEFDTSEIRALQENQSEKESRAIAAWQAGVTSLNETRAQFGYDPDPAGDYFLLPNNATPTMPANAMSAATDTATTPTDQPAAIVPTQAADITEGNSSSNLRDVQIKAYDWQGLRLRRQPTELEARCIKALDEEYQKGKIGLESNLLQLRKRYADQIAEELDDMDLAEYYTATVRPLEQDKLIIGAILAGIFIAGAKLIASEIALQRGPDINVTMTAAQVIKRELIQMIASTLVGKIANDVQARGIGAASSASMLNQPVKETVQQAFRDGSTAYVGRAASEGTNVALAQGREAQITESSNAIEYLVYSAVLDNATCMPCGESDGLGGQLGQIPAVPNPQCDGRAQCRCVHIPVVATEQKAMYRGVDVDLKPTSGMKSEAQRGLDWRKEYNRGGTAVGVARARDIINGKELSPRTVRRMYSFFSRHEVDKQGQGFSPGEDGYPSAGRIAWALWGGDAGYTWAKAKTRRMDSIDEGDNGKSV
jgi:HK97 family phage portal protein